MVSEQQLNLWYLLTWAVYCMISLHYQLHQIQVALCVCLNCEDDLDVTWLWFLLSQDDKTAEDDSINKRRRKGNNYLTEVRSPNKVSQSAHTFVFVRRNVNVITLISPLCPWRGTSCLVTVRSLLARTESCGRIRSAPWQLSCSPNLRRTPRQRRHEARWEAQSSVGG